MKKISLAVSLLVMGVVLSSAIWALGENGDWWWAIGPTFRGHMEVKVTGSSYVQQNRLHAASASYSAPGGVGAASLYADRMYDDGFVALDPGTIVSGDGLTWNWGYTRAEQYNAVADTLTFSRGGGRRVSLATTLDSVVKDSDDLDAWGVEFSVGGSLGAIGRATMGWQAGLGLIWDLNSRFSASTFAEKITDEQLTIVDVYPLDGVVPPNAPYTGTYEGPGPLIPNRPGTRREATTSSSSWRAENEVRLDLDAAVQQLWIGPRITTEAGRLAVFCMPFVSLNRLEARYERDEWFYAVHGNRRTTLAQWNNRVTDEQTLWGIGVRAGARVALAGAWFLDVGAGVEGIESVETRIGPNVATLDLSGYSVVAQIGAAF